LTLNVNSIKKHCLHMFLKSGVFQGEILVATLMRTL
jgi:hypothetical protein